MPWTRFNQCLAIISTIGLVSLCLRVSLFLLLLSSQKPKTNAHCPFIHLSRIDQRLLCRYFIALFHSLLYDDFSRSSAFPSRDVLWPISFPRMTQEEVCSIRRRVVRTNTHACMLFYSRSIWQGYQCKGDGISLENQPPIFFSCLQQHFLYSLGSLSLIDRVVTLVQVERHEYMGFGPLLQPNFPCYYHELFH